ncbi:MAG: DUF4393 domain-containing protein [Lachnospiraceae bacterium]|nr:DUF4393 domain-containing protein [Lachnospiraceae bacterium]
MSENTTINTLLNAELPPSVDNAIKNLTDQPTLSAATTFSDLWYLVFGGISYLSEKKKLKYSHALEEFRKSLESSIEQIPLEKKIDPSVQVTAQALENSKYCIDQEELRKMFAALISNSMNIDFQNDIHPSFAEIIKQMSIFDANVIQVFKGSSNNGLPLGRYELKHNNTFSILLDNVFLGYPTAKLDLCSLSISSLCRLGLLTTSFTSWSANSKKYEPFKTHPWFRFLQNEYPDQEVDCSKGLVYLTPLGRSFIKVCLPN